MVPIIIISFLALLYFLYAWKWGVIRLLSSSLGLAIGLAVFFLGINRGHDFIDNLLALELSWEFILVGAGILGVIAYLFCWAIIGFILKFLFNPDSFLHPLSSGLFGGILSLIATVVTAFFVFSAVRISGTLFELNHTGTIAQPEIVTANLEKLPEPSRFTLWRDQIEDLPVIPDWLDRTDPFSRLENRNLGILSLFAATQPARDYVEVSTQTASIMSNRRVNTWINGDRFAEIVKLNDRVGLVLNPDAIELAADPEIKARLRNIDVPELIDEFVQYLKTNKTPPPVN